MGVRHVVLHMARFRMAMLRHRRSVLLSIVPVVMVFVFHVSEFQKRILYPHAPIFSTHFCLALQFRVRH